MSPTKFLTASRLARSANVNPGVVARLIEEQLLVADAVLAYGANSTVPLFRSDRIAIIALNVTPAKRAK